MLLDFDRRPILVIPDTLHGNQKDKIGQDVFSFSILKRVG